MASAGWNTKATRTMNRIFVFIDSTRGRLEGIPGISCRIAEALIGETGGHMSPVPAARPRPTWAIPAAARRYSPATFRPSNTFAASLLDPFAM
jgi:hypothetical protein